MTARGKHVSWMGADTYRPKDQCHAADDSYGGDDVKIVNAVFPVKDEGGRTTISQLPSVGSYYPQAREEKTG